MSKHRFSYVVAVTFILSVIVSVGCATNNVERDPVTGNLILYPFTTGFHAPLPPPSERGKKRRFVVWSDYPVATNTITGWLLKGGQTVVERVRLEEVFNEQKIRLTHTPDDQASLLRVGKLLGGERVIFAEINITPAQNAPSSNISVAVRSINVESGEIKWAGTATMPQPIMNAEAMIPLMVMGAMRRATCPLEEGYTWTEMGPGAQGAQAGCHKKQEPFLSH